LLGLVVVVAVFGAAAFRVLQISRDLKAARDQLNTVERQLKAGRPGAARKALVAGAAHVTHANSTVYNSPELSVLNAIPVARQNVKALKESVSVALQLTAGGQRLLDTALPLVTPDGHFEVPLRKGAVPLPVIDLLRPQLEDLASNLPLYTERPRSTVLMPQVRQLVKTIYRQSDRRRTQAASLQSGLDLLSTLSGDKGPRRLLIAVANAAEMRGTGGMILAYGELVADQGTFSLERFGPIDELALKTPAPTPANTPADYLKRFEPLGPTFVWRNANAGGDFTYIAPILEAMYDQATGQHADGVLQIDSMGLAALMKGTGPVDVNGLGTVTKDNVVQTTLSDAYTRFPAERTVRQEVTGDVAEAVFKKLVTGDYPSLRPLAKAIIDAVAERRMELHLADPDDERNVTELSADGRLPGSSSDFAMLSVQNFAGNKLDYYLDTDVHLTGNRKPNALGRVQADITITNNAPVGQTSPQTVFGPFNPSYRVGEYVGTVDFYLPRGTALLGSSGDIGEGRPGVFSEAERSVVSFPLRVGAGGRVTVHLDLQLAPGADRGFRFVVVPVSRVRPTTYVIDLDRGRRGRLRFSGPVTKVEPLIDQHAA
jgi:hypothetical protein